MAQILVRTWLTLCSESLGRDFRRSWDPLDVSVLPLLISVASDGLATHVEHGQNGQTSLVLAFDKRQKRHKDRPNFVPNSY